MNTNDPFATMGMISDHEVAGFHLYRLRIPLLEPYHLAYGDLQAFDTILACVRTRKGSSAWGETTPLPGYSREDAEGTWALVTAWAQALKGLQVADALAFLHRHTSDAGFACAGLATALETLGWCGWPRGSRMPTESPARDAITRGAHAEPSGRVALIGTIRSTCPAEIEGEASRLLDAGYSTLKLKIGTDVDRDLAGVSAAQRAILDRGMLRIDANQGYSLEDGRRLLRRLKPTSIQLLEQPFPSARWDWVESVGKETRVPLMLDESISSEEDVRRASAMPGVRYVKFKLMKAGSIARLRSLVELATALGLGVVVGNGVAADIGCLHEAQAVGPQLRLAGEMNGFLKLEAPLLTEPLRMDGNELIVPPPGPLEVRSDQLDRYCVASCAL